jgi:hypothetical protein
MRTLSRLVVATAIMFGSASVALSQTAQYDITPEKYFSYGAKPGQTVRGYVAPKGPISPGPSHAYDQTSDGYLSYGGQTPDPVLGGAE